MTDSSDQPTTEVIAVTGYLVTTMSLEVPVGGGYPTQTTVQIVLCPLCAAVLIAGSLDIHNASLHPQPEPEPSEDTDDQE